MRRHAGLRGWGTEMDEAQALHPTFTGNFNSRKGSGLHKYAWSSRRPWGDGGGQAGLVPASTWQQQLSYGDRIRNKGWLGFSDRLKGIYGVKEAHV